MISNEEKEFAKEQAEINSKIGDAEEKEFAKEQAEINSKIN